LRQAVPSRTASRRFPGGQTRPVFATTVSGIDVLAAALEPLDAYGCKRAIAPSQAGEPSAFGILATDREAMAQGSRPGLGAAKVAFPDHFALARRSRSSSTAATRVRRRVSSAVNVAA
jgi:hypothetical protein